MSLKQCPLYDETCVCHFKNALHTILLIPTKNRWALCTFFIGRESDFPRHVYRCSVTATTKAHPLPISRTAIPANNIFLNSISVFFLSSHIWFLSLINLKNYCIIFMRKAWFKTSLLAHHLECLRLNLSYYYCGYF